MTLVHFDVAKLSFLLAVKDLNLQVLSSTTIKVSWTPPPNADRLPLTYHVSYSSEFTSSTSKSTTEQSLDLTGLHPFDVYTVTVEAQNSRGRSGAVMANSRTMGAGTYVHEDLCYRSSLALHMGDSTCFIAIMLSMSVYLFL